MSGESALHNADINLSEEESTRTVMAGLREVIETQGLFCALYSDRGSHFFICTPSSFIARPTCVKRCLSAFSPSSQSRLPPIRRRRGAARSGVSGVGKGACRRRCGWRESAS
jgi:hypothetical protein